jgi:geranylgeranyl pyrophosphate synthase
VEKDIQDLQAGQTKLLAELLAHILGTQGKRLRPTLTLLASKLHGNSGNDVNAMAAAVEILHIASLVHDDTVDDSDLRRGKDTINRIWGRSTAVLVGDYLFASSANLVCRTSNIRVIRRFAQTAMDLSSGEVAEMSDTYDVSQTCEDYFKRIYYKTASLFSTAAESGAMLSGAPISTSRSMRRYGRKVGLAYQIVDDILDFQATGEETGKSPGLDLAHGVMTLPIIIALERTGPRSEIYRFLKSNGKSENVGEAVEEVQDQKVLDACYQIASGFLSEAIECLTDVAPSPARDSLEELASYVIHRRS